MRLPLALGLLCALLCGCVTMLAYDPQDEHALLDAYLIAHGMAASYASEPGANPKIVAELQRLDNQAINALRNLGKPSGTDAGTTAQAIAALAALAGQARP